MRHRRVPIRPGVLPHGLRSPSSSLSPEAPLAPTPGHLDRSPRAGLCLLLPALLASGCNRYELFNQAGYEQASFSNDADIVFVIDNSPSMAEETAALALNFNTFIDVLTSEDGAEPDTDTLSDAVDNYVTYTQERGRFLDYNLAITTTSVDYSVGPTSSVDPGEAGLFIGSPTVIEKGSGDVAAQFRQNLLCDAAYWQISAVPRDPEYECDSEDPETPATISQDYLDCVCGGTGWEDNPLGSGDEEPLEAALMALCRSVPDPPEACYNELAPFASTTELTNDGWYRDEGTIVVVTVSDEGDNSRRLAQGEEDPEPYLEAFQSFEKPVKFVSIGLEIGESGGPICPTTTVPVWSIERMQALTDETGGFYGAIAEETGSGDCVPGDFAGLLQDLGKLLANLEKTFQLQSVPDVSTIRVWIDGAEIDAVATDPDAAGEDVDTSTWNGWTYDSAQNAIVFWGPAIPPYNADVEIFYRPLDGKPRDLPF